MNKCTTIIERRKQLIEVSKVAKILRDTEEIDGTINYMLLNYIYKTGNANEFKTFEEWQNEGFGVRKGAKAFVAWGKPRERKNKKGNVVKYFPVSYLFSDQQVYKKKNIDVVNEAGLRYGNFVGEIKLSYKRNNDPVKKHVTTSNDVVEVLRKVWSDDMDYRESFYVLPMNQRCDVLGYVELFKGGLSSTVVDVKMIFQLLLNVNATQFVVAHNHPAGGTRPSGQDIMTTRKILECARMLDLALIDHVIITSEEYYSFADNGQI